MITEVYKLRRWLLLTPSRLVILVHERTRFRRHTVAEMLA